MMNSETNLEELLKKAKEQLNNLQSGEVFLVKDLYRGYEWNRIKKGDRTKLGMLFNSFSNMSDSDIEPVKKTPQNQWIYKKK